MFQIKNFFQKKLLRFKGSTNIIKLNTNYKMLKLLNPWMISNKLENLSEKQYLIKIPINNYNKEIINDSI